MKYYRAFDNAYIDTFFIMPTPGKHLSPQKFISSFVKTSKILFLFFLGG